MNGIGTCRVITSSEDAVTMAGPLVGLDHEELWVIYLNGANNVMSFDMMHRGGISKTVIDKRLILRRALMLCATAMIIIHNHPSGIPEPGSEDIECTDKLMQSARLMDIQLMDHIVIGKDCYFSFADNERKPLRLIGTPSE